MVTREERLSGIGMTSTRTRARMVERLRADGIRDEVVLAAMNAVPRHIFVDEALAIRAYEDTPLPIGSGQTISQPWVVARMTELARAGRRARARAGDRNRMRLSDCGARADRGRGLHGRADRRAHCEGATQPAGAQGEERASDARRRHRGPGRGPPMRRDRRHRGNDARSVRSTEIPRAWRTDGAYHSRNTESRAMAFSASP